MDRKQIGAIVAVFLVGWCAVALAQSIGMGQGIGDLPTERLGATGAPPGANCLLISGTSTNCLLISGTTTNALLIR